ncbi:MAG: hypothetical protein AAFX99_30585, partial [Myxococcota bacterium]
MILSPNRVIPLLMLSLVWGCPFARTEPDPSLPASSLKAPTLPKKASSTPPPNLSTSPKETETASTQASSPQEEQPKPSG